MTSIYRVIAMMLLVNIYWIWIYIYFKWATISYAAALWCVKPIATWTHSHTQYKEILHIKCIQLIYWIRIKCVLCYAFNACAAVLSGSRSHTQHMHRQTIIISYLWAVQSEITFLQNIPSRWNWTEQSRTFNSISNSELLKRELQYEIHTAANAN